MAERLDWPELIETALTMPGNVGNVYNRFYNYSFMNQVLLMMQGVREPVATYKGWEKVGRQVLKGSKAKEIIRPIFIEKKDDDGEVTERRLRFKAVRAIFALCDTEGPELPPVEVPAWDREKALKELDIEEVPFHHLDGNTQGYSIERKLAINPVAHDPVSTWFHEAGHIVLGHTVSSRMTEYLTHRGLFEFQAEATAYLTMNELDVLDEDRATKSRGYIQSWLRGEEPPSDQAIRQVFSATDTILRAGRAPVEAAA